jgi:pimeloyl-ACP methyl ester carboxylesterase
MTAARPIQALNRATKVAHPGVHVDSLSIIATLALAVGLIAFVDSPLAGAGKAGVTLTALLLSTLIWIESDRLSSRIRWLAVTAVGALILPIALGYAAGRLMEGSLLAGGIAAAGALAAAALLTVAAIRAIRAVHGLRRVAALIAVLLGFLMYLQLIVMPVAAAAFGVHPPRMPIAGSPWPGVQSVALLTPGGAELGAWYAPGTNGAAVIVLPGALGNRGDTAAHAALLNQAGYAVLALDARGSGTSSEFGNMWGWTGSDDIAGGLDFMDAQGHGAGSVALVGLSMGGEQAISALVDQDLRSRIAGVVAEGVEARVPADIWYVESDAVGQIERLVSTTMWTIADAWSDGDAPSSLREAISSNTTTPILLIAADTPGERAVGADMAERSMLVELWQTQGIGHTQALAAVPGEWRARVLEFLEMTLGD